MVTKDTAQFLISIISQISVNPLGDDAEMTLTNVRKAHEELTKILEAE